MEVPEFAFSLDPCIELSPKCADSFNYLNRAQKAFLLQIISRNMLKNIIEIFRYSELIKTLVAKDLRVRYTNSVLGYAWTWLDPIMSMFTFILVFDIILSIEVEHFPVFLLSGLIPWTFFSNSVISSVPSILTNSGLIKRVYYPREIFPLTIILSDGINMLFSIFFLIPIVLAFGLPITRNILLLPIPTLCLFFLTFGISLMVSSINVFLRDMSYITPFVVRLLFFVTPIFYTIDGRIPDKYMNIYILFNPMAVIISLYRTSVMNYPLPTLQHMVTAFSTCFLVFVTGYGFFKKIEDSMVKRI
jgi:lipopolysaccharide transport system permease protein